MTTAHARLLVTAVLACTVLAAASRAEAITACRTPWEMHPGAGVQTWGFDMGSHGNINEYDYASIPDPTGPGWVPAPDDQSVNYNLNGNSTLCGVVDCRYGGEFTYFKTTVYLPPSLSYDVVNVTVSVVDDGVRMTVFSPSNPNGVTDPGGYAFLGGGSSSNLHPYMSSDPYSTIVLTHVDDCCSQSLIEGVEIEVTVEGRPEELAIDCGIWDEDGDGVPPAGGDCDDADPSVYPGAPEVANGEDDDCDEVVDEGTEAFDDDGDGFDENGGDCDDANPFVFPDAEEACDQDVQDLDCDGCPGSTDTDCGGTCGEPTGDDDDSAAQDDDDDSAAQDDDDATTPTEPAEPTGDSPGCDCSQSLAFFPLLLMPMGLRRRR